MANEKTLEILKQLKADPKAKELFEGMEKPKSLDEMISAYAQFAEKLGYGITAEDIREVVEQEDARLKAETEKVVSDMEALEDDDLDQVVGGYSDEDDSDEDDCEFDFNDTYCFSFDKCDIFNIIYFGCSAEQY